MEEIAGMILHYGRRLAEKQSESLVKDCVITVNPQLSLAHRLAVYKASLIAGLNPLSFIGENSAAALHMVMSRNELSDVNVGETNNIIMYNLGSSGLKVTLCQISKFNKTETTTTSTASKKK